MRQQVSFGRVKQALLNIENEASYYVGGSLCIDFTDHPCVMLNRDGRGFAFHPDHGKLPKIKFLVTKEMETLINQIYEKHRGLPRKEKTNEFQTV